MPKLYSGKEIIAVLTRRCGFEYIHTRGSHVKLRSAEKGMIIVPMKKEVKPKTFHQILKTSDLTLERFIEILSDL